MRNDAIERFLKGNRQRLFLLTSLKVLLLLLTGWLSMQLILLVFEKYLIPGRSAALILIAGLILFASVRACISYFRIDDSLLAESLDQKHRLKERLSTYVQIRDTAHPFLGALGVETAQAISPLPLIFSDEAKKIISVPVLVNLLLLASIATIPFLPVPQRIAEKKEELQTVRTQMSRLNEELRELQKKTEEIRLNKSVETFRRSVEELEKNRTTKSEALKKLNQLRDDVQKKEKQLQAEYAREFSEKLPKSSPDEGSHDKSGSKTSEQLLRELEQKLKEEGLSGEEIEKRLAEGKMSEADLKKMKKALEDYKAKREEAESILAEVEENLKQSQGNMGAGKNKVTFNSRIRERLGDKGEGGVEDGPGTTNEDIGPGTFDTRKQKEGEYVEDRTRAEYEQKYKGQREEVGKDPLYLPSEWNDQENSKYVRVRTFGLESSPEMKSTNVELVDQEGEESEIRKEKIPATFEEMVQDYFDSIDQK